MASPRRAKIQQIDAVIKKLHDTLLEQLKKETPAEKAQFKVAVLEGIFQKAQDFYAESVAAKFAADSKANAECEVGNRKETGAILRETLQLLENEFHYQRGRQQDYVDKEVEQYLNVGTNGASASKADISENENSVYLMTLAILGILYRQRFCLEQMMEVGAKETYTNAWKAISEGFDAGVKKIKPDEVERLEAERQQFNAVFTELVRRLQHNDNPKPFEVKEGDESALAQFIRKVNDQLFSSEGISRFLTKDYLDSLKARTEAAAALGNEADVLERQKNAKSVKIRMSTIVTNLGEALKEYKQEIDKKVQSIDSAFIQDLKDSLESQSAILEMRYILAIADAMFNAEVFPDANKPASDFECLAKHAQTLQDKAASLDVTLGRSNGWAAVGTTLKQEVDTLKKDQLEFVQKYRDEDKRGKVGSVSQAFLRLNKAFEDQCTAHHKFPKDLATALKRWEGRDAEIPAHLNRNWLRDCKEIALKTPSGIRAFFNRHRGKMAIGGVVTGVAAALFGIFALTLAWPVIVVLAVLGIVAGAAIVAVGAKLGDKCCKTEPVKEKLTLEQAEANLEMDLAPGAKPRRSSSAESFAKLDGGTELGGVVIMGERSDSKATAAPAPMVATATPALAPMVATATSAPSYNPFDKMDDKTVAKPVPVSPNNPFK